MPIPDRQRLPCVDPRFRLLVTDDGSRTLENVVTGDTFHSGCGAASECQHVYLENSGLGARFREGRGADVLEVGFGTGLAFLITAAEAIRGRGVLRYTALEPDPLGVECLRQVLTFPPSLELTLGGLRDGLLERLAQKPTGDRRDEWTVELGNRVHLRLLVTDAVHWQGPDAAADVVYFDPFSPTSAPELWSPSVLRNMAAHLRPAGVLVSYCVSSQVRRVLSAAGFDVRRVPGPPGGKREVLVATKV